MPVGAPRRLGVHRTREPRVYSRRQPRMPASRRGRRLCCAATARQRLAAFRVERGAKYLSELTGRQPAGHLQLGVSDRASQRPHVARQDGAGARLAAARRADRRGRPALVHREGQPLLPAHRRGHGAGQKLRGDGRGLVRGVRGEVAVVPAAQCRAVLGTAAPHRLHPDDRMSLHAQPGEQAPPAGDLRVAPAGVGEPDALVPDPRNRGVGPLVRVIDHGHRAAGPGLGRQDADRREHARQVHRRRAGRVGGCGRSERAGVEAIPPASPEQLEGHGGHHPFIYRAARHPGVGEREQDGRDRPVHDRVGQAPRGDRLDREEHGERDQRRPPPAHAEQEVHPFVLPAVVSLVPGAHRDLHDSGP